MVDIHSATAEVRRGKKRRKKKKNVMSASATQGGHKKYKIHSAPSLTNLLQRCKEGQLNKT